MKTLTALLLALTAQGKPPTADEALAWLKSLDTDPKSAPKQPRFADLTVEGLKTLKEIRLGGHRASDGKHVFIDPAGFRFLAALPALEKCNLGEVDGFTDEALAQVCKVATLTELDLGDAGVTNAGLAALSRLKALRRLQLGWTLDVGDAGMPALVKLTRLEFLGLGGTKVTDAGLAALAAHPALKEIHLMGTAITDKGLQSLAGCKALTLVQINAKVKVTPKGIEQLKKALPNCAVMTK